MAWNYDPTTIGVNPTAQVRFLIGDTNPIEPLLQDEEINFVLQVNQDGQTIYRAAWRCCEAIAGQFARWSDTQTGDLKLKASDKFKQYTARAIQLRSQAYTHDIMPYAGGLSISDKESQEQDTDRIPPFFSRNKEEYPGTSNDNPITSDQNETS